MKKLAVIILFFSLFSCGRDGAEKPEHLLSEDEMENVLYDMSLLQAIRSSAPAQLDSARVDAKSYIYKKYNIDSLTLVQNQRYYASDIENYQKLHKKVTERLTAVKAPLDSVAKKQNTPKKKTLLPKSAAPSSK